MTDPDQTAHIASVVATYWVFSIFTVYLNKILMRIMEAEDISLPAPLFVMWYQCMVTSLICWFVDLCGKRARGSCGEQFSQVATSEGGEGGSNGQSAPKYLVGHAKQISPLSLVFVGMITFNQLHRKYVEYNVARSFYSAARFFIICFIVFFSRVFLGIPTSLKTILCLVVVVIGFLIGSYDELNFSVIGTLCGITSSLFISLNSVFTKKVLPVVDDNHWKLTFYNNMNASFLFIPIVVYFEGDIILNAKEQLTSGAFWSAMSLSGVLGFPISIVSVLLIKATSPLTHNISGTAKSAVQSLLAFLLWGKEPTPTVMGILGMFTVLGGCLLYTFVKMSENAAHGPPSPSPQPAQQEKTFEV